MEIEKIIEEYKLKTLLVTFGLFMLAAIVWGLFTPTKLQTMLSLMFGLFVYLIIPGYFILININMGDIERVILSTAIGISFIPLILFNMNLFMIKMSKANIILVIVLITITGILIKEFKSKKA
ncbi:MAG: hypothetical protein MAG795_00551 [Candidatus Woesearchaeota archaeon]|nr:hypothetical protein [Candidatus Woesearchaeota archaeon]